MLVDGAAYFRAVRTAILNARHSVFILTWDIDTRINLVPEGADDGFPHALGEFIHAVIEARPGLNVYVLNWDYSMLYAMEREWLTAYKADFRTHPRLQFRSDAEHPIGASHHQKIVVVDDAIAFVGGLDLTRVRWDTPEHAARSPLRHDASGKAYAPFHDVQALVDGAAAAALGELVRTRWQRAGGKAPPAPALAPECDPWPAHVAPDVCDIDVAISRTEPEFEGNPAVHEVHQLHLDAIAAAQRHMYFENQYFTCGTIADALAARLEESEGPEVAMIAPHTMSGWLEQVTMGVLRARVHQRLKASDLYSRYRMYYPKLPDLPDDQCLNVHSKVFAIDDELFSIGSANLSNRSMALDTECNLSIEARGNPAIRTSIANLRNRLLAEHLDTTPDQVAAELTEKTGLHQAIAALDRSVRTLAVIEPTAKPELDALTPKHALFDPERPIDPEQFVAQLLPADARRPAPRRLIGLGALALILTLLAVAWRWTPLGDWVDFASLAAMVRSFETLPFAPIAMVACFVIAGAAMVPVTLLIAVSGVVFGPFAGSAYALAGAMLSAAFGYGLGHWLGKGSVRELLGSRANRLSQRLARRGVLAIAVIRLLPLAPFTIINVVAGASHISLRDFLMGTLIGILPGTVLTMTFVHHLTEAVRAPSTGTVAVLAVVAAVLITAALGLNRLHRSASNQSP